MGLSVFSTSSEKIGKKGQVYPDQRRNFKDSKTGRTIWQMTDTPGRLTKVQYATQNMATPDSKWLVYGSDRSGEKGKLNLFKMNLETGESIQLTESNKNIESRWAHISPDGREVYFIEDMNHFKAVNLDTLEERSLCRVDNCFRPHQISVSPDNRFLINGIFLENKKEEDFLTDQGFLIRSALVVIRTDNGKTHRLLDGNTPRTHAQYCPTNPNLILYCYGGPWWYVQRLWLINADGTGNRPIFRQTHFEGAGHEFWGADGQTFYVFCNGGREPQGLWAVDVDGNNEQCVLAGACKGHGTANPQQDRFVVNEIYCNYASGLWMARKGSNTPELLCQTGWKKMEDFSGAAAHPRFLPNGKMVAFNSIMSGSPEVYLAEV
jgi:Tol biopolymer transport system component